MPLDMVEFKRIHGVVRSILPSRYDTESIAVDIMIEYYEKGIVSPGRGYIRNRCIDVLRATQREQRMLEHVSHRPNQTEGPNIDDQDQVESLTSVLNPTERKLIIYRFYLSRTLEEISKDLSMDINKVRDTIAQAVYKMRQASND